MVKKIKERLSATWPRLLLEFLILIVFVCHAAYVFRIASLDQLESFAYDERLKFSMAESVDKRIVIVDIDEASLQEVGRWPWSRDVLAVLLEQLFEK